MELRDARRSAARRIAERPYAKVFFGGSEVLKNSFNSFVRKRKAACVLAEKAAVRLNYCAL
jgi:hypothetical protein